jgi:hypothetical protein
MTRTRNIPENRELNDSELDRVTGGIIIIGGLVAGNVAIAQRSATSFSSRIPTDPY